jgi:hypothetical protein
MVGRGILLRSGFLTACDGRLSGVGILGDGARRGRAVRDREHGQGFAVWESA